VELYPYFLIALTGLMIGSFLNVVIYRVPLNMSLSFPGSRCPSCEHALLWYHNIPLWGYLVQKGRCAHCQSKISLIYPLVEIVSAFVLCLMYWHFGHTVLFYKMSFLMLMMAVLAIIDYQFHIIPDKIILFSFPFAFLFTGLQGWEFLTAGIFGFLIGGLGMFLIAVIGRIAYKKDAMGGGDIKLAALLGLFLGWEALLFTLFTAFILMTVIGWIGIAVRKMQRGNEIPMAPFLTVAVITCVFFEHEILHWYIHFIGGH
jgi:leader peptidase (prepilin peptidase)/N-methyltransferase